MSTWFGEPTPEPRTLGVQDWLRIVVRGAPLLVLLAICFPLLLILRLPERWIWGLHRPVTPFITQFVCIFACHLLGLSRTVKGEPMALPGAFVANHVSWLDIFVLNASARIYFVAKSDVRGWGGIGWLARGTGTVFIDRDRRQAAAQKAMFEDRLLAGHRLLFFPEGTSSDGLRVLPFKPTLFAAFFEESLRAELSIQPITLRYNAPQGQVPAFYGWWGDMDFGPSLLQILAAPRQGSVDVIYHTPLRPSDTDGRKEMARFAEDAVRRGLSQGRG